MWSTTKIIKQINFQKESFLLVQKTAEGPEEHLSGRNTGATVQKLRSSAVSHSYFFHKGREVGLKQQQRSAWEWRAGFGPWWSDQEVCCSSQEGHITLSIIRDFCQPTKLPQRVLILAVNGIILFPLSPKHSPHSRSPVQAGDVVLCCQILLCQLAQHHYQFSCYPSGRLAL